jgi:hypothetical protein
MIRYLERRLGSSARNLGRKWGSAGGPRAVECRHVAGPDSPVGC